MDLEKLREPLDISNVDFRVQSVNRGGYATILSYKDARVDMNRLDEVVGAGFWKREHFDNNTRCRVSIYNKEIKEWVYKEDVGTKSNTEAEKGLSSDSFKRACFNFGIGRELYDYPVISIKLKQDEFKEENGKVKTTFNFKLRDWKWTNSFKAGVINSLKAIDNNGNVRFNWAKEALNENITDKKELPKTEDRLQALTLSGFSYLMSKGSKDEIKTALNGRRMSKDQRDNLEQKIK